MFGLGAPEMLIILLIGLFLFGGDKLPKIAKSVGETANNIKRGFEGEMHGTGTKKTPDSGRPVDAA